MTVYILSDGNHSDWTILGIYSTREKAESEKMFYERDKGDDSELRGYWKADANEIREIELDKRIDHSWIDEEWK